MLKNRIKNLISLIENTEIDEIEVSSFWGGQKIRLSKNSNVKSLNKNLDTTLASKPEKETEEVIINDSTAESSHDEKDLNEPIIDTEVESQPDVNLHEVKAPLVGTFYSSPKPTDPSFINVGDKVSKGQVLCIIEAMKIFNEIESEYSGKILKILVEDATPVEFDQDLLVISNK